MVQCVYRADLALLPQMLELVEETLERYQCPMAVSMRLCIAMEELLVNICSYAYPDGEGELRLTLQPAQQGVILQLADSGVPFDPLKSEVADAQAMAATEKIGGLGIHIVKQTMDQLCYRYEDGQNILTMTKSW